MLFGSGGFPIAPGTSSDLSYEANLPAERREGRPAGQRALWERGDAGKRTGASLPHAAVLLPATEASETPGGF